MANKSHLSGFRGLVAAEVVGWEGVSQGLSNIATDFPKIFKQALAAEVANLKKSIAATLRNYKIVKFTPVPNLIHAARWHSLNFAPRNRVTKILSGLKNNSALSKPGSVKINGIPGGFEVGHFGGLAPYASRFQDGVPRTRYLSSESFRHWLYRRLGGPLGIHDAAGLNAALLPQSPPRPYIVPLAEKTRRDFIPGLVGCLEMISERELRKTQK